jgi:hypothetical protein
MMKEVLLAVAALAAVIAVAEARVEDQSLPGVAPQRAYLCFEGSTANEVMAKANEAGTRGWRLVAAAPGQSAGIWCFEQYGASRPAKAQ